MNYYPETYKDYKVSFNKELANYGNTVMDFLLENNFFHHPDEKYNAVHVCHLQIEGGTFKIKSKEKGIYIEDSAISDIILNKIVREFNSELLPTRLKFEILDPIPQFNNIHKKLYRYPYLYSLESEPLDARYDGAHPSVVWHFDNLAYNNMVSVTFLDEVTEAGGGTLVSSEGRIAVYNVDKSINEAETFRGLGSAADIKAKQIIGPAGTIVTFNSHLLHSGGVPLDKSRKAMLIDFHSKDLKHFHPGVKTI